MGRSPHTTNYLQNRSPTKAISANKTPYELWYGRQPNLSYLKTFGCPAHVFILKDQRQKFDSHSFEAIFLGYSEDTKAYRLLNVHNNKLIISRDVIFDELFGTQPFQQENVDSEILITPNLFQHQPTQRGNVQHLPQIQQIEWPPIFQTPPEQPAISIQPTLFSPPSYSSSPSNPNISPSDKDQVFNTDLLLEDDTISSSSSKYAPLSSLARSTRQIKPTRRFLESIAGCPSTKRPNSKTHQANMVSPFQGPPKTCKRHYPGQILHNGRQPLKLNLIHYIKIKLGIYNLTTK